MSYPRAQILNGEIYYSPNCDRTLSRVPPIVDKNNIDINPFRPRAQNISLTTLQEVLQPGPRPWTKAFGWLAFTPLRVSYNAYPFDRLANVNVPLDVSASADGEKLYSVPPDLIRSWRVLEDSLYGSVVALKKELHAPMVLPFRPSSRGLSGTSTSSEDMRYRIRVARDWYTIWMGALSYLIAFANMKDYELGIDYVSSTALPSWAKALEKHGYGWEWMDGLILSSIVSFKAETTRLGCFLSLGDLDPEYPSLEWLTRHHVPVWYRWGTREEELSKVKPHVASLRPLSEILQSVVESRTPTVTDTDRITAPDYSTGNSPDDLPYWSPTSRQPIPTNSTSTPQPSWVRHFREVKARENALPATELPKERLNRIRDPDTNDAVVYEWRPSSSNGLSTYRREEVAKSLGRGTLCQYSSQQKVYNAIFNTWDCCSAWGPGGDMDDGFNCDTNDDGEILGQDDCTNPNARVGDCRGDTQRQGDASRRVCQREGEETGLTSPEPLPYNRGPALVDPYTFVSHVEIDPAPDLYQPPTQTETTPVTEEYIEHLNIFYGFVLPLPDEDFTHEQAPERSRQLFGRLLDSDDKLLMESDYLSSSHCTAAALFFHAISSKDATLIPQGVWDLRDDCLRPLKYASRLKYIRRLVLDPPSYRGLEAATMVYYVFDLPNPTVPWKLAVLKPQVALTVCRLPETFSEREIIFYLAQRGVAFRTLGNISVNKTTPQSSIKQSPYDYTLPATLPKRPFDYKFSKADYNSYVHLRTTMLRQPHMQAAIKRGGLLWRLSVGEMGLKGVAGGPSQYGTMYAGTVEDVKELRDTELTPLELNLLCGAYDCISADNSKIALKSWWPLVRYYEKDECGENYGRWTRRREAWYEQRLKDIEDGKAQPMTFTAWKSSQHGPRLIRVFHSEIQIASAEFVQSHCVGWKSS